MWAGSACKLESPLGIAGGPSTWLDFADGSTVYSDAGSTLAVNNDAVHQITNKGSGADVVQPTLANRAIYKTGIQNGRAVLDFDYTDDYYSLPVSVADPDELTVMIAGIPRTAASEGNYWFAHRSESTRLIQMVLYPDTPAMRWYHRGSGNVLFGGYSATFSNVVDTMRVFTGVLDNTADSHTIRVDRDETVVSTYDFGGQTMTSTKRYVGAYYTTAVSIFPPRGDICEYLVWESALSDYDRSRVNDYLLAKWGKSA